MKKSLRKNTAWSRKTEYSYLRPDNAGLSLVELIVALLILGIVSASILRMFIGVANTNKVNKDMVGADAVAENIMEAVKVNGLKGTAIEAYEWNKSTSPTKTFFGLSVSAVTLTGDETITKKENAGKTEYTFKQHTDNKYKYTVGNVTEGTKNYRVEIEFDSNYEYSYKEVTEGGVETTKTVTVNDKPIYNYNAFDENSSVLINPLVADIYYDEEAVKFFTDSNKDYVDNKYYAEKSRIDSINSARWEKYYADKKLDPTTPEPTLEPEPLKPGVEGSPYQYATDIGDAIVRDLTVTVDYKTAVGGGTDDRYMVSAEMLYSIPESYDYIQSGITYPGTGFCFEKPVKDLKSVYLFYIPYPYITESNFKESTGAYPSLGTINLDKTGGSGDHNQHVYLKNNTSLENLEFYIVVQGKYGATFVSSLQTGIVGTKDAFFYSNATLSHNGKTTSELGKIVTTSGTSSHEDNIVNVTVKVYDGTELCRSMTSTIEE